MDRVMNAVPAGGRVLDLGCASGSIASRPHVTLVGLDLEPHRTGSRLFVQGDAARLPFPDRSFDAIVSNHSFEHFSDLDAAVQEVSRVLKANGLLYVAVPDARTLCDRLYRWLARGGGHVNPFTNPEGLAAMFTRATGLRHAGTRVLYAGFSWLNRRNVPGGRLPRRALLVGGGYEPVLRAGVRVLHLADRLLGTRLSVYGWAFYFGDFDVDASERRNVCVRCGSGHPAAALRPIRGMLGRTYECPVCGTCNFLVQ